MRQICNTLFALMTAVMATSIVGAADRVDFNRNVRPILSDKCFHCHGPDASNQESSFRLNTQEAAIEDLGGYAGIVPGDLEASELHARIHDSDPDTRMPPPDSKLELTNEQRETLDQWIREGAAYDQHWSFKPITRPELPDAAHDDWTRNEIDFFVQARLKAAQLEPSRSAKKERLIRRVTLDLTGLPPAVADVKAYLEDKSDNAWEKVVDRLLATDAYGERMALVWLDAARYADSGGYQNDIKRTQWPWRDWVIDAYNRNLPFDEFTIQQLAGDLLENPTSDQLLATAFNRNHRINNEGGIIPEEFRIEYVADRVETTSTVWLGLTVGCARCHDHKYDPISQKDFYRMFAFFNSVPEKGRDGQLAPVPNMPVYTGGTKAHHEDLKQKVSQAKRALADHAKSQTKAFSKWFDKAVASVESASLAEIPAAKTHLTFDELQNQRLVDARNRKLKPTVVIAKREKPEVETANGGGLKIGRSSYVKVPGIHAEGFDGRQPQSWLVRLQTPAKFVGSQGPVLSLIEKDTQRGYRLLIQNSPDSKRFRVSLQIIQDAEKKSTLDVVSESVIEPGKVISLAVTFDGLNASGVHVYIDGKPIDTEVIQDSLDWSGRIDQPLLIGASNERDARATNRDATFLNGVLDDFQFYDYELTASHVADLATASPIDVLLSSYTEAARPALMTHFLNKVDTKHLERKSSLAKAEGALDRFEAKALTFVSVMEEMPEARATYLLKRGVYDAPDETESLQPASLSTLPPMSDSLPKNRLGLARWLVDPMNPLTARVAVNRYWQTYFGRGLVATQEDFGSQGANPTHPKLLDWLAAEFIESGWDIKAMQKKIVMSATYRQSSRVTPKLLKKDRNNELLSRGPRFRLSGQALRDQALSVSGMLSKTIGGPPVMPYQPAGLWDEVSAKGYKYIEAKDEGLYRRSLYTFWRRTVPPPSMMNFDNSAREACSVRFNRTNTPMQALNLMNDPQFVEAARCLAQRMLGSSSKVEDQIRLGYRTLLAGDPSSESLEVLKKAFFRYQSRFDDDPEGAKALVSVGASKPDENLDVSKLAAMTLLANVLLNLDEAVTKE